VDGSHLSNSSGAVEIESRKERILNAIPLSVVLFFFCFPHLECLRFLNYDRKWSYVSPGVRLDRQRGTKEVTMLMNFAQFYSH